MSSPEEGQIGADQHERAERHLGLAPLAAAQHHRDSDDAAQQESCERADDGQRPGDPAQVDAEDPGQLDVAEAHACGVDERQEEVEREQRRAGEPRPQQIRPSTLDHGGQQEESHDDEVRRNHDPVGQPPYVDVDGPQGHRDGREIEERRQAPLQADVPRGEPEQDARAQLHQRIADRDRLVAGAAAASQDEPRHDRDVVAFRERRATAWAARPWTDNRLTQRNAVDHDIQERPDEQSDEGGTGDEHPHSLGAGVRAG